jgi:predicted lipid-binding transport protein (Tim44 family)
MFGAMPDFNQSLEMFKTMWGNSPTPGDMTGFGGGLGGGAAMPTLDIEELDKRIQDLKSVENWLNLNMSVLRSTIQGLEVQRATLAALQSFSAAMTPEAMAEAGKAAQKAATDMAKEMASTSFTGKKTASPRPKKPRASKSPRATGD